ncbi:MAG: isoleucine--tRNA ligase [Methanoculleus sp. SDB]|nr:MAG: isoleucine--tRNA ligase [Methanoculleus sp. SDB]
MKEVTSNYTARGVESAVQEYWAAEDVYKKVKTLRAGGKPFFFVDGPPYTTGYIHLGTAWNKIIKDCILRYERMCGRNVIDRAGYDMHGLPIEVRVEQELGFASKKDIEEYGIAAFIEKCKTFALTHKDIMSEQFKALGVWMDFDDPYETVKPEYIEAAWWTLAKADEKGLLEQGYRVVNLCPRCETAIADSEVEYWDEEDPSIYVKFPLRGRDNEYLVIWTTTPWTLPANVAVAVSEDFVYARVNAVKGDREEILWIAEELVEDVLRKGRYRDYTVLATVTGAEMVGMVYDSPLAAAVPVQRTVEHRVVAADHVTLENTGMVHTAPGHGWEDSLVGQAEGLTVLCPVDGAGLFTDEAGIFAGSYVRDANDAVLDALGDHLLASDRIVHRYGHCWRCKTPIISISTEQWFIPIPKIKEKMLAEIEAVTWYPEWAGSARFHDFVSEARDWCISRQRYWGIPIPIWQCDRCDRHRTFATIADLTEASGTEIADPHRPYVDEVTVPCACGGTMHRVEDIFDVWFDSAMASWATLRFPGETAAFEDLWPADFITEGQDQTRGWFYSQLGASTIAFDRAPYKNVLMHGFALDAEGRKMSKSFGNVVSPESVIDQYGVDVLRLYILSASAPWDDLKFNWEGVKTVNRAVNILWNVYRFPLPYMILDGFAPATGGDGTWNDDYVRAHLAAMPDEDRWIISRIHSLAAEVSEGIDGYNLHRATRALITSVLEDISRWYIQLVRPRMWLEEDSVEKRHAYETMYSVMRMLVRLLAPFTPHISEEIYRNLRTDADPESVHMLEWSRGEPSFIDEALEARMRVVQSFDEAVANARQAGKRKLRWPVQETVVVTDDDAVGEAMTTLLYLCESRANSRTVRVVRGRWDRIGWKAEPVMRAIGPKFGKQGPLVKGLIENADGDLLKTQIDASGEAHVGEFTVTADQLTFTESLPDRIFAASMEGGVVYVDVTLTDDIEAEGYAREVMRRIQEMRRQLDLKVEDFITADIAIADDRVRGLLSGTWENEIREEVRAVALALRAPDGGAVVTGGLVRDWDVEGIPMAIGIAAASHQ